MALIRAKPAEPAGLDMTPVIDMVFLLLIFFLAATTFRQAEREMKVILPAAATGPITSAMREIVVNVLADGSIVVRSNTVTTDELHAMLREAAAANPDQKVTVRGDRAATYESVVAALDACKRAGIQDPFLETVMKR